MSNLKCFLFFFGGFVPGARFVVVVEWQAHSAGTATRGPLLGQQASKQSKVRSAGHAIGCDQDVRACVGFRRAVSTPFQHWVEAASDTSREPRSQLGGMAPWRVALERPVRPKGR